MVDTPRSLLLVALCSAWLALPACRTTQRVVASGPRASTCLPSLEAPTPVGTKIGEQATKDFILRVHDVRDILDLMPVIQRVGRNRIRTERPEDVLISDLLAGLDPQERTITDLSATDSGAVIVKAPLPIQEKIAAAIHQVRTDLVLLQVGPIGSPTPVPSAGGDVR